MPRFLKVSQGKIIGPQNKPVILKGVNLGGWLLMEGYILHSSNVGEQVFKKDFKLARGEAALKDFEEKFRNHFITEKDIKTIAQWGFNCLRVPFHYRVIEKKPYQYDKSGIEYLDKLIQWAEKYQLYVILDLHAAQGSQNQDWHSDSTGKAELWTNKSFEKRTCALWKFLACRYQNNTTVAGYDLLNEAVVDKPRKLNQFYKELIKQIRAVDKNHILFIEGNLWATDIQCLDKFKDDNYVISIHFYHPIDFVFNFVPELSYPLRHKEAKWDKAQIKRMLRGYQEIAKKHNAPIFVGEFGVNSREGIYGEGRWLKEVLECFKSLNFHWTYWTYKTIKNSMFPDGIVSYFENSPWINRQGPNTGWATYAGLWPKYKNQIISSWQTKYFKPNKEVFSILKDATR